MIEHIVWRKGARDDRQQKNENANDHANAKMGVPFTEMEGNVDLSL